QRPRFHTPRVKKRRECPPDQAVFPGLSLHQKQTHGFWCGATTAAADARRRRTRGADRLSADRYLDPPTPSASPARLLSQPTVLIHLAAALWALGLPAQHWRARRGLEVEPADVCVDIVKPCSVSIER